MSQEKVIDWLASGETGNSSKSLAFEYLGSAYSRIDAPHDPSDLGRCLRLIDKVPAVRKAVDALALKHPRWAIAAKAWDEMAQSMENEVGIDWSKGKRATKTYNLMKGIGL